MGCLNVRVCVCTYELPSVSMGFCLWTFFSILKLPLLFFFFMVDSLSFDESIFLCFVYRCPIYKFIFINALRICGAPEPFFGNECNIYNNYYLTLLLLLLSSPINSLGSCKQMLFFYFPDIWSQWSLQSEWNRWVCRCSFQWPCHGFIQRPRKVWLFKYKIP